MAEVTNKFGDVAGAGILVGGRKATASKSAKVFVGTGLIYGGTGTTVPTSTNPVGDYTTKLIFMGNVLDDLGSVIDMVNNRFIIPEGYRECRVTYNLAWTPNATGWRGCRIKNAAGNNFGNTRILSVGAGTTTNNNNITPWIPIVTTGASAPDTIAAGDYLEFYPAHNSGINLVCGADGASSFVQLEVR